MFALLDALKGPVYADDSQVAILCTYKEHLDNSTESYYKFSVKILEGSVAAILNKGLKDLQRISTEKK